MILNEINSFTFNHIFSIQGENLEGKSHTFSRAHTTLHTIQRFFRKNIQLMYSMLSSPRMQFSKQNNFSFT